MSLNDFLDKNKFKYEEGVSFSKLTTYRCGGIAKCVVYPNSIDLLVLLLKFLKENKFNYKIFGNGSNILVSDKNYDGVIIKLSLINDLKIDDTIVTVGAGYNLSILANKLSCLGLTGLEFACGIPGSIGGAIYMNAGAYLKDMSSIVSDVLCLDNSLNLVHLKNEEMNFSYRKSILSSNGYICLQVTLNLEHGDAANIKKIVADRMYRRIEAQPLEYPSAGSVFRNPEGLYAGKLIEDSNLKGYSYGGAEISSKHANFIINKNKACSNDIKYLMDLAHDTVKENYDIDLYREQELFNWE